MDERDLWDTILRLRHMRGWYNDSLHRLQDRKTPDWAIQSHANGLASYRRQGLVLTKEILHGNRS